MFSNGDQIVYGSTGVCRVEAVGVPEHLPASDTETLYYKLAPVYSVGYIYIPVNAPVFMRPVMNREQAERLVKGIPQVKERDLSQLDNRMLTEKYRNALSHEDPRALVCLIKSVKKKLSDAAKGGHRPAKLDRDYMDRARELLYGELAVSLAIPKETVGSYIREKLGEELAEEEAE